MAVKDRLYKGKPSTIEADLFVASKDYEGLCIWVANNTANAAKLTLKHTDTATSPVTLILVEVNIDANSIADFRIPVKVLTNEKISGLQGTTDALTVFIDGVVS